MSRPKKRLVIGALIAFTLWPMAQMGLVKRYDVNPWKLAGWGMYSAPQFYASIRVFCLTPDEVGSYELRTLPADLQDVAGKFQRLRLGLRRLVRPEQLGLAVLDHYSAIDGVRIEVVQRELDPVTGIIGERSTVYEYAR